jgi:hypothetical protein
VELVEEELRRSKELELWRMESVSALVKILQNEPPFSRLSPAWQRYTFFEKVGK